MDIRDLRNVVALASTLNFNKAAKTLFISQPSLSQSIKRLEERLHIPLFYRDRTQVQLTPAGRAFVEKARPILAAMEELEQTLAAFQTDAARPLVLGISQFYGRHLLSRILAAFQRYAPQYALQIQEGESHQLESLIANGRVDLGIFPAPVFHPQIRTIPLYTEHLLFAFHKRDTAALQLLKQEKATGRIDLSPYRDFPFVLLKKGLKLRELSEEICRSFGFSPCAVLETENLDTVSTLVSHRHGAAFLPDILSLQEYPDIAMYPIESRLAARPIVAAYHESRPLLPEIQDLLRAALHPAASTIRRSSQKGACHD